MAVQLVQPVGPVGRHWRRPRHPFQIRAIPYQIQPFLIAPVLPGETMKNLLMQSRVVSDPVKNPIVGWHQEYYFFYVKLRDLSVADALTTMLLTPGYSTAALQRGAVSNALYTAAGSIDYVNYCLEAVTKHYFRDEGETWNANVRGGIPLAQAIGSDVNVLDSLTLDVNVPEQDPNDTSMQDMEKQQMTWEFMRAQKLTNLSFEDFLKSFGVNTVQEKQRPELIRYVKEWTYPSNTIDPISGAPSSALSWSIQERADKDRFFREHGFLFGVTVTRPKVYISKQTGTASGFLNDAFVWMPAALREHAEATLKEFAEGSGPLPQILNGASSGAYWLDMKDLFLYGEQFVNFALTATDAGLVALPSDTAERRYVADADVDAMFKSASANFIRQDGVVQLAILGAAQETT